jgi:hypothetical protein
MLSKILKGSATALLALLLMTPLASAQRGGGGFHGGGFGGGGFHGGFGGGFRGGFRGGFYGGGLGFGYWGPGWGWGYYPYWSPYGYYYGDNPAFGQVKLIAPAKNDQVYVDGTFAGTAGQMKHFHLPAGNHNIEVRDGSGHDVYQQQINVIGGHTIDVGTKR